MRREIMRQFVQTRGRNKAPQVWEVAVKNNAVTLRWGQLGGAMQTTTQTFEGVSVGKTNFKTPAEVAENWAERQVLLREREGYVECDPKTQQPLGGKESAGEIDWEKGLPPNLRFFKPQNSLNAHCEKLLRSTKATLLRKRDGMMHVIEVCDAGGLRMYSSKLQRSHKDEPNVTWLERFPNLAKEISELKLPAGTVLLGELCTTAPFQTDEYGMDVDDFVYVGSIVKSLTPLALEKQAKTGWLGFCIWDIAFWEGRCLLQEWEATARYQKIRETLDYPDRTYLTMPEMVEFSTNSLRVKSIARDQDLIMDCATDNLVTEVLELAKKLGWEGWVVVDGSVPYDDKSHNFHGKAERPKFVCKLKPTHEADFIVRWDPDNGIGARGKGKKSKGVGSVMAYLWDPEAQQEVPVCEVGGGLTDEDVARFANPKLYPMVWVVEFSEWTPKGALRFPVFLRERDDKTPEECLISQRPEAEEGEE